MIKISVSSKEEFEWIHTVISCGVINVPTDIAEDMEKRGINLQHEVTFEKAPDCVDDKPIPNEEEIENG